jgi:hypothetical protein
MKGILPETWVFKGGEMPCILQIGYSAELKKHMSLQRKPSMLDSAAFSTLIPCESWGGFGKEYFLKLTYFNREKFSVFSKYAYSAEVKKHIYLSNENHLC